jgi:phage FluMu gp28-like protein
MAQAGVKFLPFQKTFINDENQFIIYEKSRRIGITFAAAYKATRDIAKRNVKGNKVWFSSADLTVSEEFIDYVQYFARYIGAAAEYLGEILIDKEGDMTARCVHFKRYGGEINAVSSNPKNIRGKTGDFYGDEFAHHETQEKMFTAAKPLSLRGARTILVSTHNGEESYFNQLINEIKKGTEGTMKRWHRYVTTIDDAIKEGILDQILGHKASKEEVATWLEDAFSGMTQEGIDEEYKCVPRAGGTNHLLTYELINAVERDNILNELLADVQGDLYVGIDVGRKKNFTVIWVDEKLGEVLYSRKVVALKNTQYRDQKKILYDVLSHKNMRRCCIDATGIGNNLAEDAQLDYGELRVEPVIFTNKVKEDLASHMYVMIEGKRTLIPREKRIREDFYSVRAVVTAAGNVRYEAEVSDEGSHADFFWAKALCLHASKTSTGPLIITSGGTRLINEILRGYE